MSEPILEKFGFDTVFDGGGNVTQSKARQKRFFSAEEVEALRARAFSEGEQKALGEMAALQARALAEIARSAEEGLGGLARIAHAHREGSAALALACGRAIAGEVLELFPQAALQKALESLAREIESEPKLMVTVAPGRAEGLQEILSATAAAAGFTGQILVRDDAGLTSAAFTLDFGDGSASYDPDAATQRIWDTLKAALATEGLHAEPLDPGVKG
ncbi:MAG: flagellar assembly protein FliH [Phenylobacterium sp.]|jgi:flagellar assembly protein FliH|uniref:flagellar assembly protein FliH n=1 Tax=Phenylobacterium sp. TaxID=1871053 RepID=UPI0025DF2330|nr:flagellar assembly protein FliH [Phenylobacterium sp.]MCA6300194.1 flagellar assembly protein FliH [Phenylobacterium sp.]